MDGRVGAAALVGIYATFALDVYSTLNSSPQTTELFAKDREATLMHYVVIGDVAALSGGLIGALFAKEWWPLLAASGVVIIMHLLYRHAVARGKSKSSSAPSFGWSVA